MTSYLEEWKQCPAVRLVHVRRDSEGRWFWYHRLCQQAGSGSLTWDHARASTCWHIQNGCRSGTPFASHIEAEPHANTERASWLCPDCKQYCASHNPCDCCADQAWP